MVSHQNSSQQSALAISKSIAAYAIFPGFWSRLVELTPRFGLFAYLMATIFESVRLLPKNHPFQDANNMGQYRIRDVLAYAANNLHGGFRNTDQYIIFGIFLLGVVLLGLQFVFLFMMIATQTAEAAIPFAGMFVTVNPETDVAHLMLDKVFGIPGFFNSCFDPAINGAAVCADYTISSTVFPNPFQAAMQSLFRFYTFGMLSVAGFVVFYYIIAMILETTNTGVPFGRRFQSIYTPIRLVIAVLLLLPLAYGYNAGQYIVLLAAKYGSGLATNSWLLFNDNAGSNPLGMEPRQLIGKPKVGEISSILNFMYLVKTCEASYVLGIETTSASSGTASMVVVNPYLVRPASSLGASDSQQISKGMDFATARAFNGQGDVKIVFGEKNADHTDYPGLVKPYCGEITMPALSKNVTGIVDIYDVYFKNVLDMWFNADMAAYGKKMSCVLKFSGKADCSKGTNTSTTWDAPNDTVAGPQFYVTMRTNAQGNFSSQLDAQIATLRTTTNPEISMDAKTLLLGWGGAGIWFNKIMSFNGAMIDALQSLPVPTQYPMIMEHIAKKKRALSPNIPQREIFSMSLPSGKKGETMDQYMGDGKLGGSLAMNVEIASLLNETYVQVQDTVATSRPQTGNTDNPVKNFVTLLFGQSGLFDFRANSEVFPLAKLAMLGREIMDKTITMLAARAVMAGVSAVAGAELGPMGEVFKSLGPGLGTFAVMGVSLGVLLYYVVPLMPFIYFFFAVGRWVKSIFEAMVAVPLWALAHLRLGGEGIPGPAAIQGYFLILEIFLRPILILFGLMAGTAVFVAMTYGMESVFNLAVLNVGGFDMTKLSSGGPDNFANSARDGIDALFYTIIYAMLVYMIATVCFKLIDLIPESIMRWGGTNTSSFNDRANAMGEVNYYAVTRADMMARDIDNEIRGVDNAASTFNDAQNTRNRLNPSG